MAFGLDSILGFFSHDVGIDLGTANTLVCVRGKGIVLSEPSVVAVKKGTSEVLLGGEAVGNVAKAMLGKTPGNYEDIRHMKDGVIADFDITETMLKYFIRKVHKRNRMISPRVVIAVPSGITAVERRAVIGSARRAGARGVYPIFEPMAAAIGVGLPVAEPVASMIVDIGGGTTEVAVISMGGIVTGESIRVAGNEFDEAIIQHMKRNFNLLIGENGAEKVKIQIGSACPLEQELSMEVRGRDTVANLPRRTTITSEEIRKALKEPVQAIVDAIKMTLERTPPELAADLVENGIVMAGGGSLLRGIDQVISAETGLPVRIAEDPLTAVARGTLIYLEHFDSIRPRLETEEE